MTPEEDIDGELNVEHNWYDGRARLTLFRERTNDAIISQTNHATNHRHAGSNDHRRQRGRHPHAGH